MTGSAPASASRTVYPLRARIRCHKCQRRFHGITRPSRKPGQNYIYYLCPHNPKNPRHAQAHPKHGRISVKEEIITAPLAQFMDTYLLGHDRAAMLQVQLPAGAAGQAERRDRKAATLRAKLARIQTAQKGLMTQTEQLGDDTTPAANAMRDRIREQFTERYNEHTAIKTELDTLTASIPAVNDPTLLDELPYAPWGAGTGPRHHPRNPVRRLRHPVPLPPRRQPGHHLGHHHRHHPRHHRCPPHRPPHRQRHRCPQTSTHPVCRLATCRYSARNRRQIGHRAGGSGFSQTETCRVLSLVNGSPVQPSHRWRRRRPASWAIRSSSDGHT